MSCVGFVGPVDFLDDAGPFPVQHFCFRVSDAEFDAILQRIRNAGVR